MQQAKQLSEELEKTGSKDKLAKLLDVGHSIHLF
jgi:hypothetical protein